MPLNVTLTGMELEPEASFFFFPEPLLKDYTYKT